MAGRITSWSAVVRVTRISHQQMRCVTDNGTGVESPSIGDFNTFNPRSTASSAVDISSHCTLAAGTILLPQNTEASMTDPEILPDRTVVYGDRSERRIWDGSGEMGEREMKSKMRDYLREVVPKSVPLFQPSCDIVADNGIGIIGCGQLLMLHEPSERTGRSAEVERRPISFPADDMLRYVMIV